MGCACSLGPSPTGLKAELSSRRHRVLDDEELREDITATGGGRMELIGSHRLVIVNEANYPFDEHDALYNSSAMAVPHPPRQPGGTVSAGDHSCCRVRTPTLPHRTGASSDPTSLRSMIDAFGAFVSDGIGDEGGHPLQAQEPLLVGVAGATSCDLSFSPSGARPISAEAFSAAAHGTSPHLINISPLSPHGSMQHSADVTSHSSLNLTTTAAITKGVGSMARNASLSSSVLGALRQPPYGVHLPVASPPALAKFSSSAPGSPMLLSPAASLRRLPSTSDGGGTGGSNSTRKSDSIRSLGNAADVLSTTSGGGGGGGGSLRMMWGSTAAAVRGATSPVHASPSPGLSRKQKTMQGLLLNVPAVDSDDDDGGVDGLPATSHRVAAAASKVPVVASSSSPLGFLSSKSPIFGQATTSPPLSKRVSTGSSPGLMMSPAASVDRLRAYQPQPPPSTTLLSGPVGDADGHHVLSPSVRGPSSGTPIARSNEVAPVSSLMSPSRRGGASSHRATVVVPTPPSAVVVSSGQVGPHAHHVVPSSVVMTNTISTSSSSSISSSSTSARGDGTKPEGSPRTLGRASKRDGGVETGAVSTRGDGGSSQIADLIVPIPPLISPAALARTATVPPFAEERSRSYDSREEGEERFGVRHQPTLDAVTFEEKVRSNSKTTAAADVLVHSHAYASDTDAGLATTGPSSASNPRRISSLFSSTRMTSSSSSSSSTAGGTSDSASSPPAGASFVRDDHVTPSTDRGGLRRDDSGKANTSAAMPTVSPQVPALSLLSFVPHPPAMVPTGHNNSLLPTTDNGSRPVITHPATGPSVASSSSPAAAAAALRMPNDRSIATESDLLHPFRRPTPEPRPTTAVPTRSDTMPLQRQATGSARHHPGAGLSSAGSAVDDVAERADAPNEEVDEPTGFIALTREGNMIPFVDSSDDLGATIPFDDDGAPILPD